MIKRFLCATFLLTVSAVLISAQSSVEQAVKNASEEFSGIKNRSNELERMKREADKSSVHNDFTPRFPEIKEDFEQIQKLSGSVSQLTAVKSAIDYATVLRFVSEIKHRAVRLKSNLFSANSEQKETAKNKSVISTKSPDIKTLLNAMDESIESFVHSSIFQNTNLVNPQDSLNAQNDLETVIKVSTLVKEKAKKLTKDGSDK